MVKCNKWTVHLLVALNLLICLEVNMTEIRTSEIDREKRQMHALSIDPFSWFHAGGYGRNFGYNRFLRRRPLVIRRFWRRRFRIDDDWW
ncbi:unnamed protein product [Cercopithifilaria johnstoni]|uniref:Neuropeptide-Like Protein n=1 Tax=Cercopithifilaria johnstoni TaxID=2874296 RepID=A0A8J2LXA6_9BILA|nr:unnamed protein product [Cercopithifilaria johnstoni]